MQIGKVIKEKRLRKNITQAELAAKLDITPQAVSRWELGVSYPDITMIPVIADVLQVSLDDLMRREPGEQPGNSGAAEVLSQSQVDSIYNYVPCAPSGKSRRVLVADDSDFMRSMLQDILTHYGHTFLQAEGGRECLEKLKEEEVDVCVLDIMMPEMDGIEVLKKIKEEWPGVRVVMLSALSQESTVRETLQLGADSFVVKPFGVECLVERIG